MFPSVKLPKKSSKPIHHNRIPRPPIVMVSGNEAKIIVKRETYDDLIKNDVLEEVRVLQGVL